MKQIAKLFPTEESCVRFIEDFRWGGTPICPYCGSSNATHVKNENRYHCNTCKTGFSVTVGTVFHRSKVDLRKWFYVLAEASSGDEMSSLRTIGKEINATKDTVAKMIKRIKSSYAENQKIITQILNHIL